MNLNQFTIKSQEAIQSTADCFFRICNQSLEPQHLLEEFSKPMKPFLHFC